MRSFVDVSYLITENPTCLFAELTSLFNLRDTQGQTYCIMTRQLALGRSTGFLLYASHVTLWKREKRGQSLGRNYNRWNHDRLLKGSS